MMVGGYLLTWGQIETALASCLHNIAPHRRGPHIKPENISKTLSHLSSLWLHEVRQIAPSMAAAAEGLRDKLIAEAEDRNTICHGWQGVITKGNSPEFVVACWHKFHETRSLGQFPKQRFYSRSDLEMMIFEGERTRDRIRQLSDLALIEREKRRDQAGSSARRKQARPTQGRP